MNKYLLSILCVSLTACVTVEDTYYKYDGDMKLTKKEIHRKFRKDKAFCEVESEKASDRSLGSSPNWGYQDDLARNFNNCMISRDWIEDEAK
ncbi:MAG: hypothetical protein EOP04_11935 [Proteobacteria bacterium]|nr:MAG: hypothetical protein EOP04_11935 [Pseudomonadota bacterium]